MSHSPAVVWFANSGRIPDIDLVLPMPGYGRLWQAMAAQDKGQRVIHDHCSLSAVQGTDALALIAAGKTWNETATIRNGDPGTR